MTTELVKVIDASEIESKNVEVGEWGLEFKGQLTEQEWYEVVIAIQKFDGKLQWYLGDLAVYADSPVTGWGESKYDDLTAATSYGKDTLKVYATVSRRFPVTFRENTLSTLNEVRIGFSHWQAVTSLDDNFAAYWLMKANDNGWGRDKLREEIRRWKEERGEITERTEKPIGIITYKEQHDAFIRRYPPSHPELEYDESTYLLELYDCCKDRLHNLGIEL